uniref:Ig-like domain-containing protein n=1 Tax=Oncorhynchus tshawytscha TaxID=74940 RepID=A0A8C8I0S0_ONCTS
IKQMVWDIAIPFDNRIHLKSELSKVNTLLCLAGDMFPDLVKISWKLEDENGKAVEVPKAEGEQLEQREEGRMTSMIIIDKEKMDRNKYICSVAHEGGPQDVYMLKVIVYSTFIQKLDSYLVIVLECCVVSLKF